MNHQTLAILDFGSQYTQLIARRVRELQVYCEIFPWDADRQAIEVLQPKGYILSGGPTSVYEPGAPTIPGFVLDSGLPILGICYGMQALTQALGGVVASSQAREYGLAQIDVIADNPLLKSSQQVWMSHGDRIETPPPGFIVLARSSNSPTAAMGDLAKHRYGVQFHPEVHHTPGGKDILRRFAVDICGITPDWTPESIIQESVAAIREQVGDARVLTAVSGGVDSSVATALAHRAIGSQLTAVFVDNGLLRKGEREQVEAAFGGSLGSNLIVVDAVDTFLDNLRGVTEPEQKRKIIGETFIRIFEAEANRLGEIPFLVQGTIYPDVVESASSGKAHTIKSHHNVGGLPEDIQFSLVEPLRYLFKDEVRAVGEALGPARFPRLAAALPRPRPGRALPGRDHRRTADLAARSGPHFHH